MSRFCQSECPIVALCQDAITVKQEEKIRTDTLASRAQQDLEAWEQSRTPQDGVFDLSAYRRQNSRGSDRATYEKRIEIITQMAQKDDEEIRFAGAQLEHIQQTCSSGSRLRARAARLFGRIGCGTASTTVPVPSLFGGTVSKEEALDEYARRRSD